MSWPRRLICTNRFGSAIMYEAYNCSLGNSTPQSGQNEAHGYSNNDISHYPKDEDPECCPLQQVSMSTTELQISHFHSFNFGPFVMEVTGILVNDWNGYKTVVHLQNSIKGLETLMISPQWVHWGSLSTDQYMQLKVNWFNSTVLQGEHRRTGLCND